MAEFYSIDVFSNS